MRFRARDRIAYRVELSPLIDVVFLLLIFFMVTTTFREDSGIPIDLPESRSRVEAAPDALEVAVSASGELYVAGEPVASGRLEEEVRSRLAREPDRPVKVRADAAARHDQMVRVYEALRAAGAEGFSIETVTTEGP